MGYTHGRNWTIGEIKEAVLEAVRNLEIDRMPSRAEVERYYNDTSLTNAITRRIGWHELAKEMGLKIKSSDTYFGKRHEQIVSEKLKGIGYEVERMSQNFPYDLLANRAIKIDVKVSRLYKGKAGNFYSFNLEKRHATCDIYILLTVDDNNEILNYYIVPSLFVYNQTQISIGEKTSKYERFINKWQYIDQYDEFLNAKVV